MNNNQNFMDSKTLLAIAFSALIFMGWSYWMQKRYPDHFKDTKKQEVVQTQNEQKPTKEVANSEVESAAEMKPATQQSEVKVIDQELIYSDKKLEFKIHSKGMGISDYKLHDHFNRKKENKKIGAKRVFTIRNSSY